MSDYKVQGGRESRGWDKGGLRKKIKASIVTCSGILSISFHFVLFPAAGPQP